MRAEEAKKPAVVLSRKIQRFYAQNLVSKWQKDKCAEIRAMYMEKQQGLDVAHNIASSKLSEEYMAYELEYLEISNRLKVQGDGYQPFHKDIRALISPAFYKWVGRQLGLAELKGKFQYIATRTRTHMRRAFAK